MSASPKPEPKPIPTTEHYKSTVPLKVRNESESMPELITAGTIISTGGKITTDANDKPRLLIYCGMEWTEADGQPFYSIAPNRFQDLINRGHLIPVKQSAHE